MGDMFFITLAGFCVSGGLLAAAALHPWWERRKAVRKLKKRG